MCSSVFGIRENQVTLHPMLHFVPYKNFIPLSISLHVNSLRKNFLKNVKFVIILTVEGNCENAMIVILTSAEELYFRI